MQAEASYPVQDFPTGAYKRTKLSRPFPNCSFRSGVSKPGLRGCVGPGPTMAGPMVSPSYPVVCRPGHEPMWALDNASHWGVAPAPSLLSSPSHLPLLDFPSGIGKPASKISLEELLLALSVSMISSCFRAPRPLQSFVQ